MLEPIYQGENLAPLKWHATVAAVAAVAKNAQKDAPLSKDG